MLPVTLDSNSTILALQDSFLKKVENKMNQREMRAQLSSRASILEHKLAWESLKYLGVIPEAPSRSPGLVNKLFGGTLDQIVRQHSPEILQRTADGWTLNILSFGLKICAIYLLCMCLYFFLDGEITECSPAA